MFQNTIFFKKNCQQIRLNSLIYKSIDYQTNIVFLVFAYLCCVFSLTPPCALNSLTIHAPLMKNDIIGICYIISVIPSSNMLYVALTKCIVKLLLFILTFVSLYLCLTKCYSSIRYSFQELYTFFNISTL